MVTVHQEDGSTYYEKVMITFESGKIPVTLSAGVMEISGKELIVLKVTDSLTTATSSSSAIKPLVVTTID